MICSQIFYFENCVHTLIIMHKNIFHECRGGGGGYHVCCPYYN